jgi:hypothetical protein
MLEWEGENGRGFLDSDIVQKLLFYKILKKGIYGNEIGN